MYLLLFQDISVCHGTSALQYAYIFKYLFYFYCLNKTPSILFVNYACYSYCIACKLYSLISMYTHTHIFNDNWLLMKTARLWFGSARFAQNRTYKGETPLSHSVFALTGRLCCHGSAVFQYNLT